MTENFQLTAEEQDRAALLREQLRSPITTEQFALASLEKPAAGVSQEVLPLAGPVNKLLFSPNTELMALLTLKNCAKKLTARLQRGSVEYDTMLAIYFAAIASALVFHHQKISMHSEEALALAFVRFKEKLWMTRELAELFWKAVEVLAHPSVPPANGAR